VDAKPLSAAQVALGTHAFPTFTVPGGPFGFYGVEAIAWKQGAATFAAGIPRLADARAGDDVLDILMVGIIP